jgi:NAD-dependent dihydropyrimidine dehydrogenase PreA subunit
MACNHCVDAPCLLNCPALAISKNNQSGAVLIDKEKCIGCGYCAWVCPYDAPKFNENDGIMEKCTFCQPRLDENLSPACVSLCPTTALQLVDFNYQGNIDEINGFTLTDIKPAMELISLNQHAPLPIATDLPFDTDLIQKLTEYNNPNIQSSKFTLKNEWPLTIFSILSPFLAGLFCARFFLWPGGNEIAIVLLGFAGLLISSLHLGKKHRGFRAVLNWRNSWLSREVLAYGFFLITMLFYLFITPDSILPGVLAVATIFVSLYSMDQVYRILPRINGKTYHSSEAFLSGLFWASLIIKFLPGIVIFGLLKTYLYIHRKSFEGQRLNLRGYLVSSIRVLLGFIFPVIIIISSQGINLQILVPFILLGEIIDRCEFYINFKLITPALQMKMDFEQALNKRKQ